MSRLCTEWVGRHIIQHDAICPTMICGKSYLVKISCFDLNVQVPACLCQIFCGGIQGFVLQRLGAQVKNVVTDIFDDCGYPSRVQCRWNDSACA